jgi:hypothetical protein
MHIWETLASLGYHGGATIKRGRLTVGYVYYLDRLTDTDLAQVRGHWPSAERYKVASQYAAEQVRPAVFVKSKAERKREAAKLKREAQAELNARGPLLNWPGLGRSINLSGYRLSVPS